MRRLPPPPPVQHIKCNLADEAFRFELIDKNSGHGCAVVPRQQRLLELFVHDEFVPRSRKWLQRVESCRTFPRGLNGPPPLFVSGHFKVCLPLCTGPGAVAGGMQQQAEVAAIQTSLVAGRVSMAPALSGSAPQSHVLSSVIWCSLVGHLPACLCATACLADWQEACAEEGASGSAG